MFILGLMILLADGTTCLVPVLVQFLPFDIILHFDFSRKTPAKSPIISLGENRCRIDRSFAGRVDIKIKM
jgi:hypothetical protein